MRKSNQSSDVRLLQTESAIAYPRSQVPSPSPPISPDGSEDPTLGARRLQRRVTQQIIADEAGVNRATVSLALRDVPTIPKKTRERIQDIAHRLGYAPDPMLSALATYRSSLRSQSFHGTLGWLANTVPEYKWREIPHFIEYYEGAKKRALERGYSIEVLDRGEMKVSLERAANIALARGVRGVLVCPQPSAETQMEKFPWDKFSAVTFGYSLTKPQLNSVTAAHYRASLRLVRELQARGFRRIGAAIRPEHDSRVDHNLTGGYLSGCRIAGLEALPICSDDGHASDGSALLRWIREVKPDAIITGNYQHHQDARRHGVVVPSTIALVCPTLPHARGTLAGMVEQSGLIGEVAVDLLVAMTQRGELGPPGTPQRVLVDGTYLENPSFSHAESAGIAASSPV